MKPRQWRNRLFGQSRPILRPLELVTNGVYGKDMGVLWAAYKRGSFPELDMDQQEFAEHIIRTVQQYSIGWMIEHFNKSYESGWGPIGIVLAQYNEFSLTPEFEWFEWATPKNILAGNVSFLQKMRYDKEVKKVRFQSGAIKPYQRLNKYGFRFDVKRIPDNLANRFILAFRGGYSGG